MAGKGKEVEELWDEISDMCDVVEDEGGMVLRYMEDYLVDGDWGAIDKIAEYCRTVYRCLEDLHKLQGPPWLSVNEWFDLVMCLGDWMEYAKKVEELCRKFKMGAIDEGRFNQALLCIYSKLCVMMSEFLEYDRLNVRRYHEYTGGDV